MLTMLNWALVAGLWCFGLFPPLGLPEGLNKHKLKEVDVWWTVSCGSPGCLEYSCVKVFPASVLGSDLTLCLAFSVTPPSPTMNHCHFSTGTRTQQFILKAA